MWLCSILNKSKVEQLSNLVESQNWSGPDSGYEQTRGKLEEFGKICKSHDESNDDFLLDGRYLSFEI